MSHNNHHISNSLASKIIQHTNVDAAKCYQCGKCSAGCPLAEDMDITSSAVMRMLQVEDAKTDEELLRSQTIWLCASCEMCISRCPMSIDIPKVMDYLRQQSVTRKMQHKAANKHIVSFHKSFLDMVRTIGKTYEIGMIVGYKLRSRKFLQDLSVAPKMLLRGKLPIIPETVNDKKSIKRIFKKSINGKLKMEN